MINSSFAKFQMHNGSRWLPDRRPANSSSEEAEQCGFTRVDLMALICVAGLLVLLVLPALARSGVNVKSLQCLNNHRRLCNAWRMYADDNRDRMVYASDTQRGLGGGQDPTQPDYYAWSTAHLDFSPGNRANWDPNYDIVKRPLWPYTGKDASIYKCPEDQSYVRNALGVPVPRVQSVTMNFYLGGLAGTTGGWPYAANYRLYFKTTEFTGITPAKIFVFIDGRPDTINWPNFAVDMTGYAPSNGALHRLVDTPGFMHDGAGTLSFGDGRVEQHRWTDPRTTLPMSPPGLFGTFDYATPLNADVAWLQDHASRPK